MRTGGEWTPFARRSMASRARPPHFLMGHPHAPDFNFPLVTQAEFCRRGHERQTMKTRPCEHYTRRAQSTGALISELGGLRSFGVRDEGARLA